MGCKIHTPTQGRAKLDQLAKLKLHIKKLSVIKRKKILISQTKNNKKMKNLHLRQKENELRVMIQKIRRHVKILMKMKRLILLKESVFHRSRKHAKIACLKCKQKRRPNSNACKKFKKCESLFRLEKVTTALRVPQIKTFLTKTPPLQTRRPK